MVAVSLSPDIIYLVIYRLPAGSLKALNSEKKDRTEERINRKFIHKTVNRINLMRRETVEL